MPGNHWNNSMSEETPAWLTEAYLESVLRRNESTNDIHVVGFTSRTAVAKGGNYVGQLLRLAIDYERSGEKKQRSVVVKTALSNEESAKKVEEFGVHAKEMLMYTNVLPRYRKLLCGHGITDQLYPIVLHVDPNTQTMIMEDLQEEGFQMADRIKGLDMDHMRVAINKIAKHHACSLVLEKQGNVSFKGFHSGQIAMNGGAWNEWYETLANAMIDEIQTWEGFEEYAEKLDQIREIFIEQAADVFEDKEMFPIVLNHGDYWMNNIMFRYDEQGRPIDSVMVSLL